MAGVRLATTGTPRLNERTARLADLQTAKGSLEFGTIVRSLVLISCRIDSLSH